MAASDKFALPPFVADAGLLGHADYESIDLSPAAKGKASALDWDGFETTDLFSDPTAEDELQTAVADRDVEVDREDDGTVGPDDAGTGGAGPDHGTENLVLTGTSNNDLLEGGDGNDVIYLKAGVDTALAGAGDDIVYGDPGATFDPSNPEYAAFVRLGSGNDTYVDSGAVIMVDGEVGDDTLVLSGDHTEFYFTYYGEVSGWAAVNLANGRYVSFDGMEQLTFSDGVTIALPGGHDLADVPGNAYYGVTTSAGGVAFSLAGGYQHWDLAVTQEGTAGNDHISAEQGDGVIVSGAGHDHVELHSGEYFVNTGSGNDTIIGGLASREASSASVAAGSGDDTAVVQGTVINFNGEAGHDTLVLQGGYGDYSFEEGANGPTGIAIHAEDGTIVAFIDHVEAVRFADGMTFDVAQAAPYYGAVEPSPGAFSRLELDGAGTLHLVAIPQPGLEAQDGGSDLYPLS